MWHRSKNAYRVLEESGFVKLLSKRVLQYHKSKIKQVYNYIFSKQLYNALVILTYIINSIKWLCITETWYK